MVVPLKPSVLMKSVMVSYHPFPLTSYTDYTLNMHAEWAHMKVWADRWSEEVIWLVKETWHILQYFLGRATWWKFRQVLWTDKSLEVAYGLDVYTEKQANLIMALAHSFSHK